MAESNHPEEPNGPVTDSSLASATSPTPTATRSRADHAAEASSRSS